MAFSSALETGGDDVGMSVATTVPDLESTRPEPARPEPALEREPVFPLLSNSTETDDGPSLGATGSLAQVGNGPDDNDDDNAPAVAKPFVRTWSPDGTQGRSYHHHHHHNLHSHSHGQQHQAGTDVDHRGGGDGAGSAESSHDESAGGGGRSKRLLHKMHKYSLYETASRYYIVGGDVTEKRFRILKIDRTAGEGEGAELSITDDKIVYNKKEMNQLLDTIDDGNKGTGGIKLRCTTWGLLGFIKFTGPWYMLLITKKSTVAMLGGHYIYQIDGTELIPLTPARFRGGAANPRPNAEESRFLGILGNLDLTRSFYYSYSYDITRTLQHNIIRERTALAAAAAAAKDNGGGGGSDSGSPADDPNPSPDPNPMFVWNSYLLQPAAKLLPSPFDWCRPIVHGYVDQAAVSVYGRTAYVAVIARRSRHFAGARFLKRGANDLGYVANDVETEQIVSEVNTTSFHSPGPRLFASPQYTSYVQHRGSIPLHWSQDATGVTPKPPIELNLVDPFYTAAAQHFDNLFERYGAPVYALNLVKARERTPRESKLLAEYTKAIDYLNQFLPADRRIIHRAWDMSRAAKSRDQDVIGVLERIAEDVVTTTGFFRNGDGLTTPARAQNGVARTNCIDCLDRTNAAQFVIGKRALGHQLHALGILEDTVVDYDTDAVNLLTHMYHDHGDTIAVQYGGSQLVNTMETYRKINQWTSHSRDMIESFKRYYNNSFLDGQRQEAYNLFLGNYTFTRGQPMLWDLATDYYLHHADPRAFVAKQPRNYVRWFTPEHLQPRVVPPYVQPPQPSSVATGRRSRRRPARPVSYFDDYWLEYYRPSTLSSFLKMFPYKMNSTIKFIPIKSTQEGRYDLSPFRVRTEGDQDVQDKRRGKAKKEVTILAPQDVARLAAGAAEDDDAASVLSGRSGTVPSTTKGRLRGWLQTTTTTTTTTQGKDDNHGIDPKSPLSVANGGGGDDNGRNNSRSLQGIMRESTSTAGGFDSPIPRSGNGVGSGMGGGLGSGKPSTLDKTRAAQWTFAKMVHESLNPSVSGDETDDYARYIGHPQTLPLVVSSEISGADADAEYLEYVCGNWRHLVTTPTASPRDATAGGAASHGSSSGGEISAAAVAATPTTVLMGADDETEDMDAFEALLRVGDNPLTVTEEDAHKKRYKAYRKWLRGKSLFKQQPVD